MNKKERKHTKGNSKKREKKNLLCEVGVTFLVPGKGMSADGEFLMQMVLSHSVDV